MSQPQVVIAVIAALAWAWLLLLRGGFWRIERPSPAPDPAIWPEVVAVVPARDEAAVVGEAVRSLLAQDYPGLLSVVLVDDGSRDGTADVARRTAAALGATNRLTVMAGTPLPAGWTGKMWAQAQGVVRAGQAHPEAALWLLTDADIGHHPGELRRMVARLEAGRLDMASLMVRLSTANRAERALVPAFVFFFRLLYPFRWVADPARATAAAAGGYVLIRRAWLERIGGVAAVKDALIDDCALAGAVKGAGGRIDLAMAEATRSLRPYAGFGALWTMIARSAYTQLDHSPLRLAGTVLAMSLGLLAPPLLALSGGPGWLPAAVAWAEMSLAFAPMVRFYRLPLAWAPLLPLVALFYMGATLDSARRHRLGRGGEWKGRMQAQVREAA